MAASERSREASPNFLQRLASAELRDAHAETERLHPETELVNPHHNASVLDREGRLKSETALLAALRAKPLSVRLGETLKEKNMRAVDWFRVIDLNSDGEVCREEFHQSILSFGLQAETNEVDALFDSLDGDGDEQLTLDELKPAFARLQASAADVTTEIVKMVGKINRLQWYAAQASDLTSAIKTAETEAARLADLVKTHHPSLTVKLIGALFDAGRPAEEITREIARWDSNLDGSISLMEFRAHVRSLGISATPQESEVVFRLLDDHQMGALPTHDLKPALQKLQTYAAQEAVVDTAYKVS